MMAGKVCWTLLTFLTRLAEEETASRLHARTQAEPNIPVPSVAAVVQASSRIVAVL